MNRALTYAQLSELADAAGRLSQLLEGASEIGFADADNVTATVAEDEDGELILRLQRANYGESFYLSDMIALSRLAS